MHGIEGLGAVPPVKQHERENEEEKKRLLIAYSDKGIHQCIMMLKERFEHTDNARDRLAFHNSEHTISVIDRTERILRAVQKVLPKVITEESIALGKLTAAFHDTLQIWSEKDGERKRFTEENEFGSTKEALDFMRKVNIEAGQEIYTADHTMVVGYAMHATIPKFSTENKTVMQPGLLEDMPYEAQAVALADLASAGMDGPERFLKEGNALFREEKLDILDLLESGGEISEEKKEEISRRIRDWSHFQTAFAEGRKALFPKEISGFPEEAQKEIEPLFNKFDESIEAARRQAEKRDSMSFEELIRDIGY